MGLFSAGEQPLLIDSTREGPWTGRSTDVSVALDLMVHDFDLARVIAGADPVSVSAEGEAKHGASADWLRAEAKFAHGLTARFTASRVAESRTRTMRIVYPSGEVNIDFLARTFENASNVALNAGFAETTSGRDPLGANVHRFIGAVLGTAARPAVTGREAADALKIALDADKAAGLPSLSFT
jgi:predicted dehydrogenase